MIPTVLFEVLILLCVGLPEGYCYCPECQWNAYTDTCKFKLHDDPSCDCDSLESVCQRGVTNGDSFQLTSSLQVAVNYTTRTDASIIITWTLPDGDHTSSRSNLGLKISYHFPATKLSPEETQTVCLTLASKTTRVEAPLNFPPEPEYCDTQYTDKISVTLIHGKSCEAIPLIVPIHDCFETMANQSAAKVCGIKIPTAPGSAKAVVVAQYPGKSVVRVSWKPPNDDANTTKYLVTVQSHQDAAAFIQKLVPGSGNVTDYKFTLNGSWSASSQLYAQVRAGINISNDHLKQLCHCCHHEADSHNGIGYGFGPPSANATFQFPDHPPDHVNLIVWPVIGGGVVIALAVFCSLYCISYIRKKLRHHRQRCVYRELPPIPTETEMDEREKDTVFLVASTEEDVVMMRKIRHLCHALGDHGLKPVYYEYVANDHNADSPMALGMNHWVELQFSRCEFVLFVCTRRFLEEWNGERRDNLAPLVYPCRHQLYGPAAIPQNISRYAIVFMGDGRAFPPMLGRFRQFDVFQLGSEDIRADDLIHYLLEVPPFVPPRVVNFVRRIA